MTIKYVEADLTEYPADIIIHGCNCHHSFGAGVAKAIKKKFPEAFQADLKTKKGCRNKLGTFSFAKSNGKKIINAYTQFGFGAMGRLWEGRDDLFEYEAFRNVLKTIASHLKTDQVIAMPKIGAGLAGGDWNRISSIIEEELSGFTVVICCLSNRP